MEAPFKKNQRRFLLPSAIYLTGSAHIGFNPSAIKPQPPPSIQQTDRPTRPIVRENAPKSSQVWVGGLILPAGPEAAREKEGKAAFLSQAKHPSEL